MEQIAAARGMQMLGVAAAPHCELLAGRLDDPHFQMRRACAETLRILAELAKELALDRAELLAEAEKALATAEKAKAERQGSKGCCGSRQGSKRRASKRQASKRAAEAAPVEGGIVPGSRKGSKLEPQGSRPGSWSGRMGSKLEAPGSRSGSKRTSSKAKAAELEDEDPFSRRNSKVHAAGFFSGKEHDNHEGEGGEGKEAGGEAQQSEGQMGLVLQIPDDAKLPDDPDRPDTKGTAGEQSWVSSESESSEEEMMTPRSAAAMADPRSALAPCVGKLAAALTDPKWQVRLAAARALAAIGGDEVAEERVVDAVEPVLQDEHEEVRCAAAEVFEFIGAAGAIHAESLMHAMHDPGDSVRIQAVKAISAMGRAVPAKCKHVQHLAHCMRHDTNDDVRTVAAKALGQNGKAATLHIDALSDAVMNDPYRFVRLAALDVIIDLGAPVIVQLAAALESKDMDVRRAVVANLGKCVAQLLESESEERAPIIANDTAARSEKQEEYFAGKEKVRWNARELKRKLRREEASKAGDLTPEDSEEELEADSEDQVAEDELAEEANLSLDTALTHYIEAIAAKLLDTDEQMRATATVALKRLQLIQQPHTGKQLLVWRSGRWHAELVANLV